MTDKPTRIKFSALAQICEWIPPFLVAKLALRHGVNSRARSFSPWSHVVALLYAQRVHAISLNDISDGLRLHAAKMHLRLNLARIMHKREVAESL